MGVTARPGGVHPPRSEGHESVAGAEMREYALASLKRKRKFWEDLLLYVSVNGVLWLIWALTDRSADESVPWPVWVSAIWGFLLLLDAIRAFGGWPGRGPITEAAIEREIAKKRGAGQ